MQVTLDRTTFLRSLQLANGIADRRSPTPSLANVLLRTIGKDTVFCAATDLKTSMTTEVSANVETEGGANVSARHLYEVVKSLASDKFELSTTDNHTIQVKSEKSVYKLLGLAELDFPRLPDHREINFTEIDAATFCDLISKTLFAVSTDDTRPHLSGIFLETTDTTIRMVSTDGHRLCKAESQFGAVPKLETGVLVPRKGISEIKRLLESTEGTCEVSIHEGNLFVKARDIVICVALIDAQFPPYQQVIAQDGNKIIQIQRTVLLDALKRVSILSSDKNYSIRFKVSEGALTLSTDNPDLGEAEEKIDVDYEGDALTIGFNARYFMDVLSEIPQTNVTLSLNGQLDPALVKPHIEDSNQNESSDYVGVVMPMRI